MTATIALLPRTDWLARLRTIMVLRPGQRVAMLPGDAVSVSRRAVSAGSAPAWYTVSGKTCVAAYQPKGAATLAASYTNLANPGTYDAAPGTAPAFASATGWTFNGSNQYLTTGVTVPVSATWSFLIRVADVSGATVAVFGARNANFHGFYLWAREATTTHRFANGGTDGAKAGGFVTGVYGVAGTSSYVNGTVETSGGLTGQATADVTPYIGAYNDRGSAALFAPGNVLVVVIWSDILTASEMADKSAAMAAL